MTTEYAITGLEGQAVVICGHSHCGAMKVLLRTRDMERMPAVREWLGPAEATRRIIEDNFEEKPAPPMHLVSSALETI